MLKKTTEIANDKEENAIHSYRLFKHDTYKMK